MAKQIKDYLFQTPQDFFFQNRVALCRVASGCTGGSGGDALTTVTTEDSGSILFSGTGEVSDPLTASVSSTIVQTTGVQTLTQKVLDSPSFTGIPRTPLATTGTSTTQVASTEFVQQELTANNTSRTATFVDPGTGTTADVINALIAAGLMAAS